MPPLPVLGTHQSWHRCWPWDLDPWVELNNGRTLTLYDLGRYPLVIRTGLDRVLRENRWGITVAGVSVRYRKRIVTFERIEMQSRCIGWDKRFFYIEQSLWKGGECANHILLRLAATSADGIVPPERALAALNAPTESPPLPHWVQSWCAAEAERPWPPERTA